MNKIIYLLSFIVILIIISGRKKNINESFENINNKFENKNRNNIWMYWENLPGKKKSQYLDLCYKTVKKNCKKNFKIHLLNEKSIYKYIPNLRNDLDHKLNIQQKVDYIRYILLFKYGGIWIDADTIIVKDLSPILQKLDYYDFVGFGCHFNNQNSCANTGKPYPANWVMASRKNGKLMNLCIKKSNYYLNNISNLKKKYHLLGREILWSETQFLLKNDKQWNYYHYDSKCIERDSNNKKMVNERIISNEEIDKQCQDKFLFIPIYNTAPGFPYWFTNMNEKQLLESDMLISKIFRKSLDYS